MGYPEGKTRGRKSFAPHGQAPNLGYVTLLHTKLREKGWDAQRTRDYYFYTNQLEEVKELITGFFKTTPRIVPRGPQKKKASKNPSTFQISVKSVMGKWLTFDVTSNTTVKELKKIISETPFDSGDRDVQRLIYGGQQLEDERHLSDYAITQGRNLYEEGRLKGGAREAPTTEDNTRRYRIETQSNRLIEHQFIESNSIKSNISIIGRHRK